MPTCVMREDGVWDVVVSRQYHKDVPLVPVWLVRFAHRQLLCQVMNTGRFGWTVVVAGDVTSIRLVEGFKHRWQAIRYAINIRRDLNADEPK